MSDFSLMQETGDMRFGKFRIVIPKLNFMQLSAFIMLAAAAFFNSADLVGTKEGNVLDFQVLIKLLICGCCGAFGLYGLLTVPTVLKSLIGLPGIFLTAIGVLFVASVPFSVDVTSSLISAALYWTIFLATAAAIPFLGREGTLTAIVVGIIIFLVGSWIAYYAFPTIGVFYEATTEGRFQARMNGLSHPNTLGIFCGTSSAIMISAGLQKKVSWFLLAIPLLLALTALAGSLSRTSMASLFISTLLANHYLLKRPGFFATCMILLAVAVLGVFCVSMTLDWTRYIDDVMVSMSKSGDVEELTTGTGRAQIWQYAIEKFNESPVFGKGLATSKVVMADYSGYTHNLWLNLFYSAGIVCGTCGIILSLILVIRVFVRSTPLIDGALLFIFITGATENVIFSPIPSAPTMLLIMGTLWYSNHFSDEETEIDEAEMEARYRVRRMGTRYQLGANERNVR